MPFSVASEHIRFFSQNSKIEFENLLNLNQLKTLKQSIARLQKADEHSLSWGFDLWRKEPALKAIFCSPSLATIAGQLKNLPKLRYGYSQYLSANCFSNETSLLYRKSCIKELSVGLCLCLEPAAEPESPFFPLHALSGLYFDIDDDFFLKFPYTTGKYIFIFYADIQARFYLQESPDPHQIELKKLGYKHGDFLAEQINPSFDRIVL